MNRVIENKHEERIKNSDPSNGSSDAMHGRRTSHTTAKWSLKPQGKRDVPLPGQLSLFDWGGSKT